MKDKWYADKRDLVKWSVLTILAKQYSVSRILQVAYYRPEDPGHIEIDDKPHPLPAEVVEHFRSIFSIKGVKCSIPIDVYGETFADRVQYHQRLLGHISSRNAERILVFLDPDTGLEPAKPGWEHVRRDEVGAIWHGLKGGDLLVFYQHEPRFMNLWIEKKKGELATAIGVDPANIKIARGPAIARDVVFYFTQK